MYNVYNNRDTDLTFKFEWLMIDATFYEYAQQKRPQGPQKNFQGAPKIFPRAQKIYRGP